MIAKLPQHHCQFSAALLHTLCSIAAEVVQDSCLNCAAMLHKLCQAAAEILALWFCDRNHISLAQNGPMEDLKGVALCLTAGQNLRWV